MEHDDDSWQQETHSPPEGYRAPVPEQQTRYQITLFSLLIRISRRTARASQEGWARVRRGHRQERLHHHGSSSQIPLSAGCQPSPKLPCAFIMCFHNKIILLHASIIKSEEDLGVFPTMWEMGSSPLSGKHGILLLQLPTYLLSITCELPYPLLSPAIPPAPKRLL